MDATPSFLPPALNLPTAPALPPRMSLQVPTAEIPSYRPLVMPSAAQMRQMAADEKKLKRERTIKKGTDNPTINPSTNHDRTRTVK